MIYLGDFDVGATVNFYWSSNAAAGQSITRSTNGTIKVYKDGYAAVTTNGITDTEDVGGMTGMHLCTIAMGTHIVYSPASNYCAVLETATIDGKVINTPLAHWSVLNRAASPSLVGTVVADAGNTALTFLTDLTSTVDDFHRFAYIVFKSGALAGQVRPVNAYVGATKFLVLQEALVGFPDGTPSDGDRFHLVNG